MALLLGCLVTRTPLPSWEAVQTVRPWAWVGGGLCGALFVTANVLMTPRLGIGTTLVITIAAQLVVSVLLDHFGAFDTPVRQINLPRVIGVVLLVVGTGLVKRF
jgi:transporter family-2 protein